MNLLIRAIVIAASIVTFAWSLRNTSNKSASAAKNAVPQDVPKGSSAPVNETGDKELQKQRRMLASMASDAYYVAWELGKNNDDHIGHDRRQYQDGALRIIGDTDYNSGEEIYGFTVSVHWAENEMLWFRRTGSDQTKGRWYLAPALGTIKGSRFDEEERWCIRRGKWEELIEALVPKAEAAEKLRLIEQEEQRRTRETAKTWDQRARFGL